MPSILIFLVILAKYQQKNVNESSTNNFRLEYVYKSLYTWRELTHTYDN